MNSNRITSIDATRGLIMLLMIFVNDLAIIKGQLVPDYLLHFSDRHHGSGMTIVDMVLPGFLFVLGMSVPFAIRSKMQKGIGLFAIIKHVCVRTLSLIGLGLMMAKGWPGATKMGFSPALWETLMGLSAILAFCQLSSFKDNQKKILSTNFLNFTGVVGLFFLAWQYIGKHGELILSLSPLHIYTNGWGILGIIAWAYLICAIIYLIFTVHRTALLASMVVLIGVYVMAKSNGLRYLEYGQLFGTQAAIAVAGTILSSILLTDDTKALGQRIRFTLLFIAANTLGAFMVLKLYGISKNLATPSWALFSCAITAALWLLIYLINQRFELKALVLAGQNVILSYLLSAIYFSVIINIGLGDAYRQFALLDLNHALIRAFSMSVMIVGFTVFLNQKGFRLKL